MLLGDPARRGQAISRGPGCRAAAGCLAATTLGSEHDRRHRRQGRGDHWRVGGTAKAVETNVHGRAQVQRLVDAAVEASGCIDVMINNAGLIPQSRFELLKVGEWERMVDVNIKGVLYGIAAALPPMLARKSGHVVNVSSVAGHKVGVGSGAATKHAVRALSEGLRQEVAGHNIRVTIISPGDVAIELPDTISDPAAAERMRKLHDAGAIPATASPGRSPSRSPSPRRLTSTRSSSARPARSSDPRERRNASMRRPYDPCRKEGPVAAGVHLIRYGSVSAPGPKGRCISTVSTQRPNLKPTASKVPT
ncbi:MAG: SDR family oxidoreductase [Amaricoccus sp.]